jgi:DNA repair photolyase
LTKSDLVLRDVDILSKIRCAVTISLSTTDEEMAKIFEPKAPLPSKRLSAIEELSMNEILAGIAIMPIMPYITEVEKIIKNAKKSKAKYILNEHLELKGDQRYHFMNFLNEKFPELAKKYEKLYADNCEPNECYKIEIDEKIRCLCKKYGIRNGMPDFG